MTYDDAVALLDCHNQTHVLRFWHDLEAGARDALLGQIEELDFRAIARMTAMLKARDDRSVSDAPMEPAAVEELAGAAAAPYIAQGEAALAAGEVGVLLVAGGQGSRLGYEGPKGCYPVGPVSDASLFQFHARKILALERKYGGDVPFYIMTSQVNDAATRTFFAEHGYFGLNAERVKFFTQGMWPALDPDGRIILDAPGHIFMSPDGHGGTLSALERTGVLADMQARALTTVYYFQVDNPLVEIADPAFVGLHLDRAAELSIKVCAKRDPDEGLGVVVNRGAETLIVEYTELTEEQKQARLADGNLRFRYGSVAIHLFALEFLKREAVAAMPLHLAHKKVPYCADDGTLVKPTEPNAYKFEKFIFDALPDADPVVNLAFDRRIEFSPVKNAEGSDSPATCRRDLSTKWAGWLDACGKVVPRDADGYALHAIEIDPCFALNARELAARLPDDLDVSGPVSLQE